MTTETIELLSQPEFKSTDGRWVLMFNERPWTLNAERAFKSYHKRHQLTKKWREAFKLLALEAKIPRLKSCIIEAHQLLPNRRAEPDILANVGAVKAAIDGLVDAKILPDDNPKYVTYVGCFPPKVGGVNALVLVVIGEPEVL